MVKMMTKTRFTIGLLAVLLALPAFGGTINKSVNIEAGAEVDDATSVNGSVTVGDNAIVTGDVSTVNGAVRVGSGARINEASTVNGSLKVSRNVEADNLSTVNGSVTVGESSIVGGSVEAVNGRISIEKGTSVGNGVGNVNGDISLKGASIGGDVSTVSGNILIDEGTIVDGDVIVEKPGGWNWGKKSRKPRIVIGPGSTVKGVIKLEREVELFISDSAEVGGVSGEMSMEDAVRFSGDKP